MARTTPRKATPHTATILGLLITLPLSVSCGSLVTPDTEPVSAVQVTARVELAHRSAWLEQIERETRALLEHLRQTQPGFDARRNQAIVRKIVTEAHRQNLDPWLVASVVRIESNFDPKAISYAGAVGLMQVLPYVGKDIARRHEIAWNGWRTLQDPMRNIEIGTAYLRELLDLFDGDLHLALAAYNMGPTLLKRRVARGWRPNGPYVASVTRVYRDLREKAVQTMHLATLTGAWSG
ncbi:MAG: lytic transglycosylase domain-containing protein [Candidatus Dadabacteria bacterium]|nr:MAG: lytic transglycosylase domain-containing protein [Candidatus Dadabacteria bacterium]